MKPEVADPKPSPISLILKSLGKQICTKNPLKVNVNFSLKSLPHQNNNNSKTFNMFKPIHFTYMHMQRNANEFQSGK